MDKANYILSRVADKDILDVGSGGDLIYVGEHANIDEFLCNKMKNVAKELVLLEIEKKAAQKLRTYGFYAIHGNAETINLRRKFDVIVLGDVIEHVDNVGMLIENMKRHLKRDGEIIITTANPHFMGHFFRAMTLRKPRVQYDHTSFITESNLEEICRRHSLKIIDFKYFGGIDKRSTTLLISSQISKSLGGIWRYLNQSWVTVLKLS